MVNMATVRNNFYAPDDKLGRVILRPAEIGTMGDVQFMYGTVFRYKVCALWSERRSR